MLKHNKKRNVGLMVEFLSRHIANCVLEDKPNMIKEAKKIWIKNFANSPELVKEYALFNALYSSRFTNREVAVSLMEKVKRNVKKLNAEAADKQKTSFIHEVSRLSDKDFFNRPVEDYKTMATISILMNMWRDKKANVTEVARLEDLVLTHLLRESAPEPLSPNVLKLKNQDVDALVVRIMNEKFEKKYARHLTESQRQIVRLHALSESNEKLQADLQEMFQNLQCKAQKLIERELATSKDASLKEKLRDISERIDEAYSDTSYVDSDMVVFHMTLAKLVEELSSK